VAAGWWNGRVASGLLLAAAAAADGAGAGGSGGGGRLAGSAPALRCCLFAFPFAPLRARDGREDGE